MSTVRSSTVDDVLSRSARRHPDRVALHFADRTWTYRELDEAVSRAALALRDLGLARGDRVAAYGRNSDAYLLGFLGCSRAGLVHVPVNYALSGDELAYLVEQSGSVASLVDPAASYCATPTAPCSSGPRPARSPTRCCPTARAPWTTATWCSCSTPPARPRAPRAR